jgi:hypothetical protein
LRDEREATIRASKKLDDEKAKQEDAELAKEYLNEQNELKKLEEKLTTLPEYSDEFQNTKKLLSDKKVSFDSKQETYFEKLAKYKQVREEGEAIKLARSSLSDAFIKNENATTFMNNLFTITTPQNEDEQVKKEVEQAAINSLIKKTEPLVMKLIRE